MYIVFAHCTVGTEINVLARRRENGTDTDTGDSTDTDDTGDFGDTEVNVLTRRSFKLGKDSQGFPWWEWES